MYKFCVFLCLILVVNGQGAREGFGPGLQDWGFAEVRPGAHMFWWLYYTTAEVENFTDRPLAIWLQGGPGASSTGYGNFEELGPLDLDLNPRNHTWVNDMNVIFIDNPVGTGFSYVESEDLLTTDNAQIAADLVEMLRQFYEHAPEFRDVELHVFSESYGGKMAAEFVLALQKEIDAGTIESNLKSMSMIDAWISPMDSVWSWAPFLLNMGIVDHSGYDAIMAAAEQTQQAMDAGDYSLATDLWGYTEMVIDRETHGVDFYNVLFPTSYPKDPWLTKSERLKNDRSRAMYQTLVNFDARESRDDILERLMRNDVSAALQIPEHVVWGSQSWPTFRALQGDFMKPVTDVVELLLNTTDITTVVITGQLDLIVATPGTINWVNRLRFDGLEDYVNASRDGLGVNGILEGYQKVAGNFHVYWINRSGHMVPADNPAAMSYILRTLTNYG